MKKTLLLGVASLLFGIVNAQVDCNISNIQGGFAGGFLEWTLEESGLYAFIDPADDYAVGQSCGASYPYTIETVDFSVADGTAFGAGDGTGTFVYSIGIYAVDGGDPCNPPGAQLATSGPISVELTGAGLTPQSIAFDVDVNDAFFVSYEPISWTGLATEVPSILWDNVARPLCVQQMTVDGGATWLDFTDFFDGGETGWADFSIFGTSDTGSGGDCETGDLTDASAEELCPDEDTEIASVIPTSAPPGGGQGILISPGVDGTGGTEGEIILTGVTFPYTLNAGLNGVLEANTLPDLAGTWDISIAIYSSTAAPIDNICSQSDIKSVVFLDSSDPACEATGGDECADWVSPTPTTGYNDFNDEFGGAPTPDGDGNCETFALDVFEVWQSEAYAMDNVTTGVEYTFSHCEGPGAGTWIPEYTIIAPSGAVDAFGAGDGDGCSITWTASETGTYLIVINEAGACGVTGQVDNGFPSITCGGEPEPTDECTDWVSPTSTTGYVDFTTVYNGAPCNDGTGCPFNEIQDFEVWQSEAYAMENVVQGAEYTFSHCNGPGAGSWVPEYTIIAPSGAIDAFGAGDGDGCSITWTASEEGTYLIVINEAGACGVTGQVDNGFPAITCSGDVECPDLGNSVCEGATPVSEGTHTYDAIAGNGFFDGCFTGGTGAEWFVYTPDEDGFATIKSCDQIDTRLSIFTGDCDNLECYESNDDDDDLNCEPDGFASSVVEMAVTAGTDYYIMWDDRWSTESADWEITFIPPPDCDQPTAEATIDFSNCPDPEFNVLVDLTGIGNATNVDIVENVNGGGETVVYDDVTAIQEYVMGPYAMGDEVTVSVVHNDDEACTIELGSFTAEGCPPENDTCADGLPISCGETLTGSNVNASPIEETCNGDNTAGGVWYSFTGANSDDPDAADGTPGDQVTMSTCSQADYDTKIDVFSGSCEALTCVGGNDDGEDCADLTSEFSFPTVVGETYYVFVSGWNAGSAGIFDLSMTCASACLPIPENDDCDNAEMLTVQNAGEGTPTIGSNECASNATENPTCDTFATIQDVWYSFNSGDETTLVLHADTIDMSGLGIVVYEGACDGEEVLCESPFAGQSVLTLNENTDYFIQVYTNGASGQGTFEIMVETVPAPPVNDDCANAISLDCDTTVTGETTFATLNDAPAECDEVMDTAPGVWYTVDGIDGTITASLCGSGFDTKIGVYSGSCGELTCIIGEDDDFDVCDSADPSVDWSSSEGDVYYIYVTGFGENTGSFILEIACDDSEPTDECLDWVSPTPETGYVDFNDQFGGAPTPDGDGNCEVFTIEAFEVWQSEAYAMDNVTEGVEYIFSHCEGPGAGSWIPEYTIIAPSGAVDAFGAGDGDGCSISWVASETGTYLIVINEAGACGVSGQDDNGFPSITCNGTTSVEEAAAVDFAVFPNPNNGQFTLNYSGENGLAHIHVLDISGKAVYQEQVTMSTNTRLDIDLGNGVSGMYFVRLTMDEEVKVVKVIVQ